MLNTLGGLGSDSAFTRHSPILAEAYAVAGEAHADQFEESDGQPYINHPVTVARLLHEAGYDDEVVAAGLLHDVLEHSDVHVDTLRARFGERVARLVAALTEPDGKASFQLRKAALRDQVAKAGADAEAIFAADKIAKSASLRRALAQLGSRELARRVGTPLEEKISHYNASLEMLEAVAADLPFLPRLHSELNAIEGQRAREDAFELARLAADAVNRRDLATLVELCASDVEWWPALTLGNRGNPYRGHEGLREYLADLVSAWSELRIEIYDIQATGDRLLVLCRFTGRGRRSGIEVDQEGIVVYRVGDGKVTGARALLGSGSPGG